MKEQQFAVIGLGQFGEAIARSLSNKGVQVMAIDISPDRVDYIASEVTYAVALDATDKKALASQNIQDFDAVVVAIGKSFENLLLCTVNLMELGTKRIIARAKGNTNRLILERLGIEEIFQPEYEVGAVVAKRLINPDLISVMSMPDDYAIAEINAPTKIIGKRLDELQLPHKYHITVITIKKVSEIQGESKSPEMHISGIPRYDTIIEKNDRLVIFGKEKNFEKFISINK